MTRTSLAIRVLRFILFMFACFVYLLLLHACKSATGASHDLVLDHAPATGYAYTADK